MSVWKRFMKSKGLDASVSMFRRAGTGIECTFMPWSFPHRVGSCMSTTRSWPALVPIITQPAMFNRGVMDVYKLFRLVIAHGGFQKVCLALGGLA